MIRSTYNWIADWRRMYRFSSIGRTDLKPPPGESNVARRIDTLLSPPLAGLPDGAVLDALTDAEKDRFAAETPLRFYVLREAELDGGQLGGVGARIVAETFHRVMEGSRHSIVRDPAWRPTLGAKASRFTMMDLLLVAYDDDKDVLAHWVTEAPPAAIGNAGGSHDVQVVKLSTTKGRPCSSVSSRWATSRPTPRPAGCRARVSGSSR